MPGKRVYELAGELNLTNKEVLDFLRSKKIDVKSHMSSLKENEEVMVRQALGSKEERKPVEKKETETREVQKKNRRRDEGGASEKEEYHLCRSSAERDEQGRQRFCEESEPEGERQSSGTSEK